MASAGAGYQVGSGDYAGLGASWGRVPAAADGTRGRDQGTFEAYYRWQALKGLQVVPGLEYIHRPAYNLSVNDLWVLSLRMRATF